MKHAAEQRLFTKDSLPDLNGRAKRFGTGVLIATGLFGGYNIATWDQEPAAEQPSPAAVAEQGAVDYINAIHDNPASLSPDETTVISLQEGDSVNSAANRAAEAAAEERSWNPEQRNLNRGVINEASAEVLSYDVKVQPGDTVVMVEKDTNGDGVGEFFPVGLGEPKK